MPLPIAYRAQQTTDTSGTGTLTLNAAIASRRAFATATGGGAVCVEYLISLPGSSEYEIGIGVHNGGDPGTLTRVAVQANHLGTTSLVSFSAGAKDVQILSLPGQTNVVGFTSSTTATLANLGCLYNYTGSAAATLTLPAAATVPLGAGYKIRHFGTLGALTIDGNGSELVGFAVTLVLVPGETVEIWATATGWVTSGVPALALIGSVVPQAAASVVDIALPVPDALYEISYRGINTSVDAQLQLRISFDGGSTFAAGGTDYSRAYVNNDSASTVVAGANQGTFIALGSTADAVGAAGGHFQFHAGNSGRPFRVISGQTAFASEDGTVLYASSFVGGSTVIGAITDIRFLPSAGTFNGTGLIALYLRRA